MSAVELECVQETDCFAARSACSISAADSTLMFFVIIDVVVVMMGVSTGLAHGA